MGHFRRCYGACFGNSRCPDILTKIFIGLLASEGSFLDLCVREETFQREVSKVSLIIKQLLTRKYRKARGTSKTDVNNSTGKYDGNGVNFVRLLNMIVSLNTCFVAIAITKASF